MNRLKFLKQTLIDWIGTITIHGIPNIFRTKFYSIKILWTISFLISTALCFYSIIESIINFLQFDVTTKIRIIEQDSLLFPTVTICNSNSFVTNESFKFVEDVLNLYNISNLSNSNIFNSFIQSNKTEIYYNYLIAKFLANANTIYLSKKDNLKAKKFGYSFDKLIFSCFYSDSKCNESEWIWHYDFYYGNCFRFNTGYDSYGNKIPLKKFTQASKFNGLTIEMFIHTPNDKYSLSTFTGAHVFIQDGSNLPNSFTGVSIPTGMVTNIALERLIRKQLPQPFSDCIDNLDSIDSFNSDLYKEFFKQNRTYSQFDCYYLYFQQMLIKKCSCYDPNLYDFNHTKPCTNLNDMLCQFNTYYELVKTNPKSSLKLSCPLECEQIEYNLFQSFATYPSESYANDLIQSDKVKNLFSSYMNVSEIKYEHMKNNMLLLNIYYEYVKQTEITEFPSINLVDLISGIGGTLGLFLGVSVLSFLEIIEIILTILFMFFEKKNSDKIQSLRIN